MDNEKMTVVDARKILQIMNDCCKGLIFTKDEVSQIAALTMACALGIEQDCNECRMCGNGKGGKKMTNFERIKGMGIGELAEVLEDRDIVFSCNKCPAKKNKGHGCPEQSCLPYIKEWLESECDVE